MEAFDSPRGKLEQTIARCWQETFRVEPVSRNTNFFELGGDSIVGTQLMDRLSGELEMELPVVYLFQFPTPRQMAEHIRVLAQSEEDAGAAMGKFSEQQPAGDDLELLLALPPEHAPELLRKLRKSKSQFRQDLFVLSELSFKSNGFFVEFGATNGVDLSNTWLLEHDYGWQGILAEPARCWHEALAANRRNAAIDTRCVWSESGVAVPFNEVEVPELSTVSEFAGSDLHAGVRQSAKIYEVETVSLNDLLAKHAAPRQIDYLSIDTEGSEFQILSRLDFDRYRFGVITCEHNFSATRAPVHDLLVSKGYTRKHRELSRVDDWYVPRR